MAVLKDGTKISDAKLNELLTSLRRLVYYNSLAFIEFVRYCRDQKHELHPNHLAILMSEQYLKDDGKVDPLLLKIVLNFVINDGINMEITNPVKQ
ncbi:MAG: hypothetical protein PHN19_05705 [Patescibacteria group bacterium]|nr:hypothetical protein [Patescibacteria group bacterium]